VPPKGKSRGLKYARISWGTKRYYCPLEATITYPRANKYLSSEEGLIYTINKGCRAQKWRYFNRFRSPLLRNTNVEILIFQCIFIFIFQCIFILRINCNQKVIYSLNRTIPKIN